MQLPYFFEENLSAGISDFELSEEAARHIAQVLRMREGEELLLTNGNGLEVRAILRHVERKKVLASFVDSTNHLVREQEVAIAISLLKNESRFEWFLEKATEIGVAKIYPIICRRTERKFMRMSRMKNILVSAMLQSRQVFLPSLSEPKGLDHLFNQVHFKQKYIAHCLGENEKSDLKKCVDSNSSRIILIGPEGDFTEDEIAKCTDQKFVPVSLGETRLRTETAGIVAAVLMI